MANTKSGFKRRFPRVGKCCCCCEPKVSVLVCTIIFIIWLGLGIFISGISLGIIGEYKSTTVNIMSKVSTVIDICGLISLILLLIGIEKRNTTFLNQFKIVFLIYVISQLFGYTYRIYLYNTDEFIEESIKTMKETYNKYTTSILFDMPDEYFRSTLKRSINYYIVEAIIIFALIVYYYLSTCSYIEDVEESLNEENDTRKLENNEY
ncbi:hypothetical protein H8356DRAFT_1371320 [Neocallimastix lanati (nom. inval.)]|uniref:Uncharacterized protein n=1 Tax=Neocallimastix californiae TaxID=1754190 RepID=A0A1Y2FTG9_9FUNG|nr:hypothetical protein H8356DRAFT_1371320 [Neocallimastix sp. JGI-2020a]ORY87310.1 hypothetical protein LY90DRAFT_498580 [Neocallimastix californiae]|eukprot:ORY87310.1 hypothetical protein LY90DRAFT_498580 [Neocallimastix californiae]